MSTYNKFLNNKKSQNNSKIFCEFPYIVYYFRPEPIPAISNRIGTIVLALNTLRSGNIKLRIIVISWLIFGTLSICLIGISVVALIIFVQSPYLLLSNLFAAPFIAYAYLSCLFKGTAKKLSQRHKKKQHKIKVSSLSNKRFL
jgi:membrane-bound ClpP family serine protease